MFQNLQVRWVKSGAPFIFFAMFSWIKPTLVHLRKKGKVTPSFHNPVRYLFIEIIVATVNVLIYCRTLKCFCFVGQSGFQTSLKHKMLLRPFLNLTSGLFFFSVSFAKSGVHMFDLSIFPSLGIKTFLLFFVFAFLISNDSFIFFCNTAVRLTKFWGLSN